MVGFVGGFLGLWAYNNYYATDPIQETAAITADNNQEETLEDSPLITAQLSEAIAESIEASPELALVTDNLTEEVGTDPVTPTDFVSTLSIIAADAQAQYAADVRAERHRRFWEGRPEHVARSIPADPKAVKRQKLTKRMCYADSSGWQFLYNDYVFDGDAVVANTDEVSDR